MKDGEVMSSSRKGRNCNVRGSWMVPLGIFAARRNGTLRGKEGLSRSKDLSHEERLRYVARASIVVKFLERIFFQQGKSIR